MVRALTIDSERWEVSPAGRVTVYGRDQFGLIFERGTGPQRVRRVTHYSPLGARSIDRALAELSERDLLELFRQSQPSWTAPEVDYAAH